MSIGVRIPTDPYELVQEAQRLGYQPPPGALFGEEQRGAKAYLAKLGPDGVCACASCTAGYPCADAHRRFKAGR